jgi:hypothetical protein
MSTRSGIGSLVAGAFAAVLLGAAVLGVGAAQLVSSARAVAPIVEASEDAGDRPAFVETLVVVGRRPGRLVEAAPAFPRDLVVSLSLGADGSVSRVQAVSDGRDDEALDELAVWLAAQRFAPPPRWR